MAENDQDVETQETPAAPATATGPEETPGGAPATFTQAQVDAMIKDRIKRERSKYADYDDLKAKAAKVDEQAEAEKSDLQKAQEKLDAVQRERDALAQSTNDKLIRMETRVQAATMGFTNPDDAYHLADLSAITIEDDGTVKGVDEVLAELAKTKPYLLKADAPRPAAPQTDSGIGNPPANVPGLTTGEEYLMQQAARMGVKLDPEAVQKRKQKARVTTNAGL